MFSFGGGGGAAAVCVYMCVCIFFFSLLNSKYPHLALHSFRTRYHMFGICLSYEMGTPVENTSLHFLSEFEKLSKLLHIKG